MEHTTNLNEIARKWQKRWEEQGIFKVKEDSKKKKYYVLEMFPYPSASFLHMGHVRNYTIGDAIARFKRMMGFNVLYPMGYDSFGLPAENAAKKEGIHPKQYTEKAIKKIMEFQKAVGNSYDWSRTIATHEPEYYKWNQWFFLKFLEKGLVYRKKAPVNWCPKCSSTLANEEVVNGHCWRHEDTEVEQKELEQWFLKITKYADELLKDLENLGWSDRIKHLQRNWIGKSEGALVDFPIKSNFVLLHGYGGNPNAGSRIGLKKELESLGLKCFIPQLPIKNQPNVQEQTEYLLKNSKFDEDTVLVGHSLGCAVALRVLEKLNVKIKKLVLVGGFIEPNFKDKKRPITDQLNWKFDFGKIKKNVGSIIILSDKNDHAVPIEQGRILAQKLGGKLIETNAKEAHFTAEHEPEINENTIPKLTVFTTRPDTIHGVTFVTVSPQHPLMGELAKKNQKQLEEFSRKVQNDEEKEKEGLFLGSYVINPFTNEEVPVYAANFVVAGYGTGAVMGVPAHDQRDFDFAKKYKLPIKEVITPIYGEEHGNEEVRKTVAAVVQRKSDGKFLALKWKEFGWTALVIGGLDGESLEKAAEREVLEETGYKVKAVRKLGGNIEAHFFAPHKNVWRHMINQPILLELIDEKPVKVSESEAKKHEAIWLTADEALQKMTYDNNKLMILRYLGKEAAYIGEGRLANSGQFNSLLSSEAIDKISEYAEKKKFGKRIMQFKIRDWLISRQRYWGTPIPVIYCNKCGIVPEKNLPLLLPEKVDFHTTGNPLLRAKEWIHVKCPKCKSPAERETDTMGGFVDSSWYFLRYCSPKDNKNAFDKKAVDYWTPVDQYIGGIEHAVGHLIYSRFWTKALRDLGLVTIDEPFTRLFNQGIVYKDGHKMSKSFGNVVYQTEISEKHGIDTARLFLMFVADPESDMEWNDNGIEGSHRFLQKIARIANSKFNKSNERDEHKRNSAIKKYTELIEKFKFNLAIVELMKYTDYLNEHPTRDSYEDLIKMISPFTPHLSEEMWEKLGNKGFISLEKWPKADEKKISQDLELADNLLESTKSDIKDILKLAKVETPKKITLFVSEGWKYELYKIVLEEMKKTRNVSDIMKKVMSSELRKHGQDIQKILPKLVSNPPEFVLGKEKEHKALKESETYFSKEFNTKVQVIKAEGSTQPKAKSALPNRPAILVE